MVKGQIPLEETKEVAKHELVCMIVWSFEASCGRDTSACPVLCGSCVSVSLRVGENVIPFLGNEMVYFPFSGHDRGMTKNADG